MAMSNISTLVLAIGLSAATAAQAGLNGESVTGTFNFAGSPVVPFGAGTVGDGVEFTGTWVDPFQQSWAISVDVFDTGVTLSWTESTRAAEPNGGNISSSPDTFSLNLSFGNDVTSIFGASAASFSSAGNYSLQTSSLTNNTMVGSNTVHFGFSRMDSTDVYTITAVPEPQTYAMVLTGLCLVGALAGRRVAKQG